MAEFLVGKKISKRIRKICGGGDVRCAVSFWGKGAQEFLFGDEFFDINKIICDISMGGTNPQALEELGAPNVDNIRHIRGFHAKVYISDEGVVVGSANASNNGLHYDGMARGLIESGVFHGVDSKVFNQCAEWFEGLWNKKAKQINQVDLDACREKFKKRQRAIKKAFPPKRHLRPSFLEVLRDDPEMFENVKFIISDSSYSSEDKDEADENVQIAKEAGAEYPEVDRKIYEYFEKEFSDDTTMQPEEWPLRFINLYRPKHKTWVYPFTRGFGVGDTHFAMSAKWKDENFKFLSDTMTKTWDDFLIPEAVDLDEVFDEYACLSAQELKDRLFPT